MPLPCQRLFLCRRRCTLLPLLSFLLIYHLCTLHPRRLYLPAPPRLPQPPWAPPSALSLGAHTALARYHLPLLATRPAPSACAAAPASYAALVAAVRARPLARAALPPDSLAISLTLAPGTPEDEALVQPPGMTPRTAAAFCAAPSPYAPDFQYLLRPARCSDGLGEGRTWAAPWCNRPSDAAQVRVGECALLESYVQDDWEGPVWRIIGGSVLALRANTSLILADASLRDGRPAGLWPAAHASPNEYSPDLQHHALLATPGPLRCAWCPGHFFLEALPILLLLDALLPPAIPLLWPAGALPEAVALALRARGALGRGLLLLPRQPQLMSVDRLYYFTSGTQGGVPTSWQAQRYANALLRGLVVGEAGGEGRVGAPLVALLALREGAATRQLRNVGEVLEVMQRRLPAGTRIDSFTPGGAGDFLADGARFARACLVIGVHGANLGNLVFVRSGCTVIELASVDIFSDYYALSRNLGLQYFVSLGVGAHGAPGFTADIEDLGSILAQVGERSAGYV